MATKIYDLAKVLLHPDPSGLPPQLHYLAATDATNCCMEPTRLTMDARVCQQEDTKVINATNSETIYRIHNKVHSLHKQRTVYDDATGAAVGSIRKSVFLHKHTYSVYPRDDHDDTPYLFQFTVGDDGERLTMDFVDLVSRDPCRLEWDTKTEQGKVIFWLTRKNHGDAEDERQPIAILHYLVSESNPEGNITSCTMNIAKGVDMLLIVLLSVVYQENYDQYHTTN